MEYRYLSAIFRCCFVLPIFWRFSDATVPGWCRKPAMIQYFATSTDATDFKSHDGLVFLCQVRGAKDPSALFAIFDGKRRLIDFNAADVTFKMMSGSIFWMLIAPSNRQQRHLKGRFQKFDDFINFHRLVRRDSRFSPQKFTIKSLESYRYSRKAVDVDLPSTLFTRAVTFSQYSIDIDVIDDDEAMFVIEDEYYEDEFLKDGSTEDESSDEESMEDGSAEDESMEGSSASPDSRESYLTFYPYEFRCTRHQIHSQVILTRIEDERLYFIIRLDTAKNASNFANYIGRFAKPEPHGLLLPGVLENFLNRRQ